MNNNALSKIQRQRRIWFEITKRDNIREQGQNKNYDCNSSLSKENREPYEELIASER